MLRGARAEYQRARPGESGAIVRSFANMTVQCIVKRVSAERGHSTSGVVRLSVLSELVRECTPTLRIIPLEPGKRGGIRRVKVERLVRVGGGDSRGGAVEQEFLAPGSRP